VIVGSAMQGDVIIGSATQMDVIEFLRLPRSKHWLRNSLCGCA